MSTTPMKIKFYHYLIPILLGPPAGWFIFWATGIVLGTFVQANGTASVPPFLSPGPLSEIGFFVGLLFGLANAVSVYMLIGRHQQRSREA